MAKIKVNGVNLAYESQGSGETIVILHGFAFSKALYRAQIIEFSKKYRVIAIDMRGHGDSDKPYSDYSPEVFAKDISFFLDEMGFSQVSVLGHSLGGLVAQVFALTYPSRVKSLILYGTSASIPPIGNWSGPWGQEEGMASDSVGKIEELGFEEYERILFQYLFSPNTDLSLIESYLEKSAFKVPQDIAIAIRRGVTNFNTMNRLNEIEVPTLVIVGGNDCRTPVENSENINRAIPNSSLKIIKGTGHMAHIEKANEFNKAVLDFLKAIR